MILRRLAGSVRRRLRGRQPVILMYHRIADPPVDPWGLAVPPDVFADQLAALAASRRLLAMDELVAQVRRGELPGDAAAITFDDGYADNYLTAKPMLEEREVPATMFLTTGAIGSDKPFWWDLLALMVLGRDAPLKAEVILDDHAFAFDLPAIVAGEKAWRFEDGPKTDRQHLYLDLWRHLQGKPEEARARQMDAIAEVFGRPELDAGDLPMDRALAQDLSSDCVTVGAHARSHLPLTRLSTDECARQIARSREDCRALTGKLPSGFAFPHGERNQAVIEAVRDAGFAWACSTAETPVDRRTADVHDLPRIAVGRWRGAELVSRLG